MGLGPTSMRLDRPGWPWPHVQAGDDVPAGEHPARSGRLVALGAVEGEVPLALGQRVTQSPGGCCWSPAAHRKGPRWGCRGPGHVPVVDGRQGVDVGVDLPRSGWGSKIRMVLADGLVVAGCSGASGPWSGRSRRPPPRRRSARATRWAPPTPLGPWQLSQWAIEEGLPRRRCRWPSRCSRRAVERTLAVRSRWPPSRQSRSRPRTSSAAGPAAPRRQVDVPPRPGSVPRGDGAGRWRRRSPRVSGRCSR